jgi:hypothetical protein
MPITFNEQIRAFVSAFREGQKVVCASDNLPDIPGLMQLGKAVNQ